jgi:hypothetical protein
MRQIKFRVWDSGEKRYLMDGEYMIDAQGGVHYLGNLRITSELADSCVIQQFTCLKDKYDAEIYEGDVLEFTDGLNKFKSKISFEIGCFGYIFEDKFHHLFWYPYQKQIVGNIFQNPDLIKL